MGNGQWAIVDEFFPIAYSLLPIARFWVDLAPGIGIFRQHWGVGIMAKKNIVLVKLESTAKTGFYFVKKKNPRKTGDKKLAFTKYDPVVRKHVEFKETKLKS